VAIDRPAKRTISSSVSGVRAGKRRTFSRLSVYNDAASRRRRRGAERGMVRTIAAVERAAEVF